VAYIAAGLIPPAVRNVPVAIAPPGPSLIQRHAGPRGSGVNSLHAGRLPIRTGRRGRSATEFYKPEAVLARAPYVWVIDTYNDRVVLLRLQQ